jgi:hypothetical protein
MKDAMHPQARSFVANLERGGGVDDSPSSFIAPSARSEDNVISRSPSVRPSVRRLPLILRRWPWSNSFNNKVKLSLCTVCMYVC